MVSKTPVEPLRARVSTENIVSPGQIGWVFFSEGEMEIAVKIIKKESGEIFAAVPVARRLESAVRVVTFSNPKVWERKSKQLVTFFKDTLGEAHCRKAQPKFPLLASNSRH